MLKQPDVRALPPPPGAIPDVTHPHNSVYKYNLACQVLTYIIVGTIVLARIFAKVSLRPGFKSEDYFGFGPVCAGVSM
ncbi:MAG: hypothetical protein Q9179_003002 [Wetmoreana sp. 5 TL-2023]